MACLGIRSEVVQCCDEEMELPTLCELPHTAAQTKEALALHVAGLLHQLFTGSRLQKRAKRTRSSVMW